MAGRVWGLGFRVYKSLNRAAMGVAAGFRVRGLGFRV